MVINTNQLDSNEADLAISLIDVLESWHFLPNTDLFPNHPVCLQSYLKHIEELAISNPEFKLLTANCETNDGTWLAGVRRLNWDSKFFQKGIGRIEPLIAPRTFPASESSMSLGSAMLEKITNEAKNLQVKHLSLAVDCRDTISQHLLERNKFNIMDTIVAYRLPLVKRNFDAVENITEHNQNDLKALVEISGECFSNRKYNINRFNSDVFFSPNQVRSFYEEWIKLSLKHEWADTVLVYREDNKPLGFITCKLPTQHFVDFKVQLGTIPLNAVHVEHHGKGIYTKLVGAALHWFQKHGISVVEIRTQISNQSVHRTWQKLGAYTSSIYHTFHRTIE
jgi:dTDP-4-amino-4,6-dideoxy-D-galactose acyltransferase